MKAIMEIQLEFKEPPSTEDWHAIMWTIQNAWAEKKLTENFVKEPVVTVKEAD